MNQQPTLSSVSISPSSGNTTIDFTCEESGSDDDDDSLSYTYFWTKNDQGPVLLMTFDKNISSNRTGAVEDLSGNGNNGTLGSNNLSKAPTWTSSGHSGGAYSFDGDDFIACGDDASLNFEDSSEHFTISVWAKMSTAYNYDTIFGKGDTTGEWFSLSYANGKMTFQIDDGITKSETWADSSTVDSMWHHYVAMRDGTYLYLYIDNVLNDKVLDNTNNISNPNYPYFFIGGRFRNEIFSDIFQGSIDDVRIYNRALSPEEINDLYEETANLLNHNSTSKSDEWTCSAIAFDGYDYSSVLTSDVMNISNSLPQKPNLMIPINGNLTLFDRTPMFFWNATDIDEDALDFVFNISHPNCPDYQYELNIVNASENNSVYNWSVPYKLCVDYEGYNNNYSWKVRAYDGENYSAWSDTFQFMLESSVIISPNETAMDFGALDLLQIYDTVNNSPSPFIFQNQGNVNIDLKNLTLIPVESQFWATQGMNKEYLQFKVDNYSISGNENYNSSFNYSASTIDWNNFSQGNDFPMKALDYHNGSNYVEVDLRLKVPGDEPPVQTSKTFNFEWSLSE